MADKPGGKQDDGGNAVDGLTPPTMKYSGPAETEKTQIGPPPTGGALKSTRSPSSPTITGEIGGTSTVHADIVVQDLSTERLLKDAPRVDHAGKQVPALNGIPLLTKIGQGGMGAVYYGVHPRLRSEVAVKVLPFHLAEQDPGMIRRFFREAQIAAQVRSPHLVNVMDVNEESGLFFLVMEYVAGSTAGHLLKSVVEQGHVGLPELDALDIAIAATEGLNAAHSQGIVHRDLKPENIMVPYLSREEKKYDLKSSKLMDLGLARSEESNNQSLTGVQAAMGTPGYMAPEQALDAKTANRASDVFGMGATLYALLTGRAPFRAEAVMKVLMATMHEPHEPVIKIRPDVSQVVSEIVDKCLDKKQENRFPDAQTLNRALKNARRLLGGSAEGAEDPEGVDLAALSSAQRAPGRSLTGAAASPGSQPTIVGAQPQSGTNVGSGSKKGMMLIAAAVVGVLAIGGAVMMMSGKGKPTDNGGDSTALVNNGGNNGGGDTGKPKPPEPAKYKVLAAEDIPVAKDLQSTMLARAESNIATRNLPLAKGYLKQLETVQTELMPLDKIDAKDKDFKEYRAWLDKEYARVKTALETEEKKIELSNRSKSIDDLIEQGEFDKATAELGLAFKIFPSDAAIKADLQKKQDTIVARSTERENRKKFDGIMAEAATLEKTDLNKALEKVTSALALLPNDADAKKAEDRLNKAINEAKRKKAYDKLIADAEAAEKNNLDDRAMELAHEAAGMTQDDEKAKAIIARIDAKLGDAKKKELAEKQRKIDLGKLEAALKEAGDLADKQKWDDADARANEAADLFKSLQLPESDKRVADLRKRITTGIEERQKSEAFKAKQEKFAALSRRVFSDINTEGLDTEAASKIKTDIEHMKKYDLDPAKVAEAEKKLQARLDYEKAVKAANTANNEGKIDEFAKQVKAALEAIPEGATAQKLAGILKDQQEKQAAKERKQQFDGYMKAAEAADAKGSLDEANKQIAEAKKIFATDKGLLDLEKKVADKIAARQKLLAQYQTVQKDFGTKFADIDSMKPDQAVALLNDFKAKMPDADFFKAELGQINAKMPVLQQKLAAIADATVAAGLKKIKDDLGTNKDLAAAVTGLQGLAGTFPNRKDVNDRLSGTKSVNTAIAEAISSGDTYTAKANDIKNRLKTGGDAEKGRLDADVARLKALPAQGVSKLVEADLLDTNVSTGIRNERSALVQDMESLIKTMEAMMRKPDPEPPKRQDPPPSSSGSSGKGSKGTVGEQNPFD